MNRSGPKAQFIETSTCSLPGSLSRHAVLLLPDGSTTPALNGVTETLRMPWPVDRPYSAIVGIETVQGSEWYVHEDGSRSTSLMNWRSDLGREAPMSLVANPPESLPASFNQ
jgi:hypothetical protein